MILILFCYKNRTSVHRNIENKKTIQQRWSPRGHGLGLEDPRGQLTMSLALALALGSKSLVLTLALDCQSLALALASEVVLDVGLEHQNVLA